MLLPKYLFLAAVAATAAATPAVAGTFQIVYSFQNKPDGNGPFAGLTAVNGQLYGTTGYGGTGGCFRGAGCGTVFAFNPASATETVLYSFRGGKSGGPLLVHSNLIKSGDKLYGVSQGGGGSPNCGYGCGTIFELDLNSGREKRLYAFQGGDDGGSPDAGLLYPNGTLYGTTAGGGASDYGIVFAFNLKTQTETVLHTFQGGAADGSDPAGELTNVNGTLYGTTFEGGSTVNGSGFGTVYSINPQTGAEAVVYAFAGPPDGGMPVGKLLNINGTLYGATLGGGNQACTAGCGTVFSLNPQTKAETVLHALTLNEGSYPEGITRLGDKLYGAAVGGGADSGGSLFKMKLDGSGFKVLHDFGNTGDGMVPEAAPTASGGAIYGTTFFGGTAGLGTIYAYTP
jgi:uncharacterized repeat protein (TIGR03803 family)